jgi:hypothetical protein
MRGEVYAAFGAVLVLLSGTAAASAAMRIHSDHGGQIGPYLHKFAMVRSSGERVIIDGNCLSACTLVLSVVPRSRICVTPRAQLGFHAAWVPDGQGRPVISPGGTRFLWALYPPKVRSWIKRKGGLNGKTIFLRGRELAAMLPPCT